MGPGKPGNMSSDRCSAGSPGVGAEKRVEMASPWGNPTDFRMLFTTTDFRVFFTGVLGRPRHRIRATEASLYIKG